MDPKKFLVRNLQHWEELISAMIQSPEAGEFFNKIKRTDPNKLAIRLANLADESEEAKIRAASAILLEGMFEEPLDELTKSLVKFILLRRVKKEREIDVMKSLCHTIVTCFNVYGWPELSEFVRGCVSGHDYLKVAAMLISGPLRFTPISVEAYCTCLENEDVNVKIAAFGAAISYIRCTPTEVHWRLARAMWQGLNRGQEAMVQEVLILLIDWAHQDQDQAQDQLSESLLFHEVHLFGFDKMDPEMNFLGWHLEMNFLGWHLQTFRRSAFKIAESPHLKKETRHLAIDFLITIGKVGYCNRYDMTNRLFGLLLSMLSDIENEAASHMAENEDDDAGESRNYGVVPEFLDRLAITLDEYSVPWRVLEEYLAAPKWQDRVAAIVALQQISEVYLKVTETSFDRLVTMVLNLIQDPVRRVRSVAINATRQLTTDLGPGLQVQYHCRVLPALATAICNFQDPQGVQKKAAAAMVTIIKKYSHPPNNLTNHFHDTMGKLLDTIRDLRLDQPTRCLAIQLSKLFEDTLTPAIWMSTWPNPLSLPPIHQGAS